VDGGVLSTLLDEHMARSGVPGAALAVLREGEVTEAYAGIADIESGEPVTGGTRFPIGSITKTVTATAIARLAGSAAIGFDDPLTEHVPELAAAAWARRATVGDVLANRGRVPLADAWEFGCDLDGSDVLARYASLVGGAEAAADVWSCSNTGFGILGRVVEVAGGEPWERAVRTLVLDPCGMEATIDARATVAEPRARGHEVTSGGAVLVDDWRPPAYKASGSVLSSTVTDLLRFAAAHLHDPLLAPLRRSQAEIPIPAWHDAWCLGLARFDWHGGPAWGWDGIAGGHRAVLRLLPEHGAAVALTTNGTTGRDLYRSLFPHLLADAFGVRVDPLELRPMDPVEVDLRRYEGTYAWPDLRYAVTAARDHLVIDRGDMTVAARPVTAEVFAVSPRNPDRPAVRFDRFDERGRPAVLYPMLWGFPRERP
jgi:CubicO group peptidase (beta-lactamase class C family)